jgi:hypothetical protein
LDNDHLPNAYEIVELETKKNSPVLPIVTGLLIGPFCYNTFQPYFPSSPSLFDYEHDNWENY